MQNKNEKNNLSETPLYGIVGNGKVAKHFRFYFNQLGIPHIHWHRKTPQKMADVLSPCDIVLLLVPDDCIEDIASQLSGKTFKLVHFSGSLRTPRALGYHPLMSFGPSLYESGVYSKIPFIFCEKEDFGKLFPQLSNPNFKVSAKQYELYHALCVLSGNFTTMLWQKTLKDFKEKLGLNPDVLSLYMNQVFLNLKASPESALTGPLARGDSKTIKQNIAALKNDPFQGVYEAFVKAHSLEKD